MARVYKDDKSWFQDFKDQFKSLDGQPFSKKIEHFLIYYWRLTAIILVSIFVVASLIIAIVRNSIPVIIGGIFYPNTIEQGSDQKLLTELADVMGVKSSRYRIQVEGLVTDYEDLQQVYAANQVILARIMGKDLDFFCSDSSTMKEYLNVEEEDQNVFRDLKVFLNEETYNRLSEEGRLVSMETGYGTTGVYFIDIKGSYLEELMGLTGAENLLGFIANSTRPDAMEALCTLIR